MREKSISPIARGLLLAAACNAIFQIAWFWRLVARNINIDAVSYIGIARHIVDGDFHASLHGYWSPMISWLIAAASVFSHDFTLIGHVVTVASFLLCLPLLYFFTLRLWRSPELAAAAVLWFTLARRLVALSVYFIGADFLLTAFVLAYFILLLQCFRENTTRNWLLLGAIHGLSFLTKSFAMPWLACLSLVACFIKNWPDVRKSAVRFAVAMVIPILVWFSWGKTLESKYGVFTAGYQLKFNLLDSATKIEARGGNLRLLTDYSRMSDSYLMTDSMYPGSPLWQSRLDLQKALRQAASKEIENLPIAIKGLAVLLAPGGLIALVLAAAVMWKQRHSDEAKITFMILFSVPVLIVGYAMLVFDERYLLPVVPLLIAVAVRFLTPSYFQLNEKRLRAASWTALVLLIICTIFFQVYWASPYRTVRDYEQGCYDAAAKLKALPACRRVVVIGAGPNPDHGIGWEMGFYSSYFAGCGVTAFRQTLPTEAQSPEMVREIASLHPDAVLLLASSGGDPSFVTLLTQSNPRLQTTPVFDPAYGQVGEVIWNLSPRSTQQ